MEQSRLLGRMRIVAVYCTLHLKQALPPRKTKTKTFHGPEACNRSAEEFFLKSWPLSQMDQ